MVLPVGGDRPGHLVLLAEGVGQDDRERAPAAPRVEVRGLPVVGAARLDPVVRADRDVEHLLGVAVPEADQQRFFLVRCDEPAFVSGVNGLAGLLHGVHRQLGRGWELSRNLSSADERGAGDEQGQGTARDNRSCRVHPRVSETEREGDLVLREKRQGGADSRHPLGSDWPLTAVRSGARRCRFRAWPCACRLRP